LIPRLTIRLGISHQLVDPIALPQPIQMSLYFFLIHEAAARSFQFVAGPLHEWPPIFIGRR
jgi:hypothetical protein